MTDVTEAAVPCTFRQPDEDEPERSTWVRITPSHYGVTILIYKDQPTEDTSEWEAMAQVHIDGCFMNKVQVQIWDERTDSEADDPQSIVLVQDVDGWQPRPPLDEE